METNITVEQPVCVCGVCVCVCVCGVWCVCVCVCVWRVAKKSTFGNKHFNVGYSMVELKCLKMGGYTHKTYQNDVQGMIMPIGALRMMYQLC